VTPSGSGCERSFARCLPIGGPLVIVHCPTFDSSQRLVCRCLPLSAAACLVLSGAAVGGNVRFGAPAID